MNFPTCTSTADNKSSSNKISLSLYNDLANEILAFWPPDKVEPF